MVIVVFGGTRISKKVTVSLLVVQPARDKSGFVSCRSTFCCHISEPPLLDLRLGDDV